MLEPNLAELIERARVNRDFTPVTDAIPYARFMGISVEITEDGLQTRMQFDDHLIGNPILRALHGGTIGALLEHAAIFALMWDTDVVPLPKTINLTTQYLRSARPQDTFARATITKRGRRVANVSVTAWQDDERRPIASGNAHFLLRSPQ
ncbi:MAG: hypothetical protein ACI8PT_001024 [Gammaproteobacteria bacterium]